ncbi:LysE family translocator [Pseudogemmobacter sonorensis]|uniref:LysE family translocator n=1 Tax=Pseudogemmobacter sonorensis TaxID=2989681 RepID=UPI00368FEBDD
MIPAAALAFAGRARLAAARRPGPAVGMAARMAARIEGLRSGMPLMAGTGAVFCALAAMPRPTALFAVAPWTLKIFGAACPLWMAWGRTRAPLDMRPLPRRGLSALRPRLATPEPAAMLRAIFLGPRLGPLPPGGAPRAHAAAPARMFRDETPWNGIVARICPPEPTRTGPIGPKTEIDRSLAGMGALPRIGIAAP